MKTVAEHLVGTPCGTKGPVLVDVVTDPNALAMPPKIDTTEVAGYGLYLAKQTLDGRLFESIDELKETAIAQSPGSCFK